MQPTATETASPSLAPVPSESSGVRMLRSIIGGIPSDAVWAALLIAAGCYWGGYQLSDTLILLYGMWMLANRKRYWYRWTALTFFTGIGLVAAHRFDMDALPAWLQGHLLPIIIILALQWMLGEEWLQAAERAAFSFRARIKLHWIPYMILAASLAALVGGLRWSVYGGTMLLLVLLVAIPRDRRLIGGLVMAALYDLIVHLFMLKGALLIQEDSLGFMAASWGTMLFPVLALTGAGMTNRMK